MLLRKADGGYATVAECLDGKEGGTVYYAGEGDGLQLYVSMYKEKGINVLLLDSMMDMQFIQFLEGKNDKLKFVRVDADLSALGERPRITPLWLLCSGTPAEKRTFPSRSCRGGRHDRHL